MTHKTPEDESEHLPPDDDEPGDPEEEQPEPAGAPEPPKE
jgi:hypothetical protein